MSESEAGDQFGCAVDIYGDLVIVGGPSAGPAGAGRVLAFQYSAGAWVSDGELGPVSALEAGADFGWAVSLNGQTAAVAAPGAFGHGSAYRFERVSEGLWSNMQRLDGTSGSRFGCSLDSDDTAVVVGAEQEGYSGHQYGGTHVFIEDAGGWTEAAYFSAGLHDQDLFGRAVALGGGQVIVGAPGNDEYGLDSGNVQIFGAIADCNSNQQLDACEIDAGTGHDFNENGILDECEGVACRLEEVQRLVQPPAGVADVSLSEDIAVLGVPMEQPNGAVYVYRSSGSAWSQEARLEAWDGGEGGSFGTAVAAYGDRVLVGAPDRREEYWFDGAAYLFHFDGSSWAPEERFTTPYAGDYLGVSLALGDGVLVLAAPFADMYGFHDGAAYVYRYTAGAWELEAELADPGATDMDYFGQSMALDRNLLVVGASSHEEEGPDSGIAYVYRYDGSQWQYEARLAPSDPSYLVGCSTVLAVADDLIMLGPGPGLSHTTGAAYVFRHLDGDWVEEACLVPADAVAYDRVGTSVAIEGRVAVVGVPGIQHGPDYGFAAVFVNHDGAWTEAARLMPSDSAADDKFARAAALAGGRALMATAAGYLYYGLTDCNGNGQLDACELAAGTAADVDADWILDACEVIGDVNCDGEINGYDIDPFVLALVAPGAFQDAFPGCPLANADANGDGEINGYDIDPFVTLLTGGR
jgi:hypothetical protein